MLVVANEDEGDHLQRNTMLGGNKHTVNENRSLQGGSTLEGKMNLWVSAIQETT